jgi:ABC-2 type transport system ATP-binding protein
MTVREQGAAVYIAGLSKHYGELRAADVKVFGKHPNEAVANGTIGAMLQNGTLLDDATVGETVSLVASLHRKPMPVAEAMRRAGVEDLKDRRCTKLSGGQKQRVRFAVALVSNPDLLVLDEPTAAMDVATRREFWASMREFTEAGRTVLFATHYLDEAEEFADRVVLMRAGQIVADGSVAKVREMASGRTITAVLPGRPHKRPQALARSAGRDPPDRPDPPDLRGLGHSVTGLADRLPGGARHRDQRGRLGRGLPRTDR